MSRVKKTRSLLLTLVAGFVVTLGAGMVVGMAAGRHDASPAGTTLTTPTPPTTGPVPPIDKTLGLTREQSEQMKSIWSEFQASFRKGMDRRNELVKERDEALYNLLNDEQKARYQKLTADYKSRLDALGAEQAKDRERAFQEAVERTKKILTDTQRQKYEQLLKQHGPNWWRHGGHGEHGGPAPFQPRGFSNGPPGGFSPPSRGTPRGDRGDGTPGWSGNKATRFGEHGEHGEQRGDPRGDRPGPNATQATTMKATSRPAGAAP